MVAVAGRRRDAVDRERREAARYAGHDPERDAGPGQRQGLLAAAAEHERVAALEAQHPPALAGQRDQPGGDALLRRRMRRPPRLPANSRVAPGPRHAEDALVDQGVVDHDVGRREGVGGWRVSRPGSPGPAPTSQTVPGRKSGRGGHAQGSFLASDGVTRPA